MSAVTPIDAGGKQTQDAMDPRVRPESKKWCCKEQEDGQEDSYDDADGLLQTLLLLSTLTLAFAVTLHSGTLGHADFEEADFRWSKHMYYQRLSDGRWDQTKMDGDLLPGVLDAGGLLSVRARTLGYICVSLSVVSLFCGASSYLSLTYSNARENQKYFKSWFMSFRWVILIGYLTFVGAILFFFFLNHIVVKIQYPWYNDDARFFLNGTVYYPPETTYDANWSADKANTANYYGADMDWSADKANISIIILIVLTFVGIFTLDQIVRRGSCSAVKKKTEAVVDPSKHTINGGGGFTPVEQLLKTFKEQQKQLQELHEQQLEEFLKAFVRNTTDKMV